MAAAARSSRSGCSRSAPCRRSIALLAAWAADVLVLTSLTWAIILGASTSIIILSGDWPMSIVIVATALGSCAGIIARNYAAFACRLADHCDRSGLQGALRGQPPGIPAASGHSGRCVSICGGLDHASAARDNRSGDFRGTGKPSTITDRSLTGLLNRRGFTEQVASMTRSQGELALFYLDLDGFKLVNDRLGHAAGDDLLRDDCPASSNMCPSGGGLSSRGDEFLVVMHLPERSDARLMVSIMKQSLCQPCATEAGSTSVGVSIGVSFFTAKPGSLEAAMAEADEALYRAKAKVAPRHLLMRYLCSARLIAERVALVIGRSDSPFSDRAHPGAGGPCGSRRCRVKARLRNAGTHRQSAFSEGRRPWSGLFLRGHDQFLAVIEGEACDIHRIARACSEILPVSALLRRRQE